jgi:CubicO group peptidase (beta-lactamase class C family)
MSRPIGITPNNWIDAPFNRWGFWNVRQLTKTALVSRGIGPVVSLPTTGLALEEFSFNFNSENINWLDFIERSYTDAVAVIHDGKLVYEWYRTGFGPRDTHLLMSCSKSLTAVCLGKLVTENHVDLHRTVSDYIPELRDTAWENCTIQMVLDMRSGTLFDESNYDDQSSDARLIEQVSGYRPRVTGGLPANTEEWITKVTNMREHGGVFTYRSLLTLVLCWIIQQVTGKTFAQYFSDTIWSQIGAEWDADLIVDDSGFAAVDGGICATLRDFARFGQMCLQKGEIGGKQVIPLSWFERLRKSDPELIDAFSGQDADPAWVESMWFSKGYGTSYPNACYHDQWWIIDPELGIYSAYGINGQQLLIHSPSKTVVAKFSSWPKADSEQTLQDVGLYAMCDYLCRNNLRQEVKLA